MQGSVRLVAALRPRAQAHGLPLQSAPYTHSRYSVRAGPVGAFYVCIATPRRLVLESRVPGPASSSLPSSSTPPSIYAHTRTSPYHTQAFEHHRPPSLQSTAHRRPPARRPQQQQIPALHTPHPYLPAFLFKCTTDPHLPLARPSVLVRPSICWPRAVYFLVRFIASPAGPLIPAL